MQTIKKPVHWVPSIGSLLGSPEQNRKRKPTTVSSTYQRSQNYWAVNFVCVCSRTYTRMGIWGEIRDSQTNYHSIDQKLNRAQTCLFSFSEDITFWHWHFTLNCPRRVYLTSLPCSPCPRFSLGIGSLFNSAKWCVTYFDSNLTILII